MSPKRHLFFLLSFLAVAGLCFLKLPVSGNKLQVRFQQNIDQTLLHGESYLGALENQLRSSPDLKNFNLPDGFDLFIYDRSNLDYWSTNDYSFDPKTIFLKLDRTFLVHNSYGSFIIFKGKSLQKTIALVAPLQRSYDLSGVLFKPKLNESIFSQHSGWLSEKNTEESSLTLNVKEEQLYFHVDDKFEYGPSYFQYIKLLLVMLLLGFIIRYSNRGYWEVLYLAIYRVMLLLIPLNISDSILFDPSVFASSLWQPNLFQFFINSIIIFHIYRILIPIIKDENFKFSLFVIVTFLQIILINNLLEHSSLVLTPYKLVSYDYSTVLIILVLLVHILLSIDTLLRSYDSVHFNKYHLIIILITSLAGYFVYQHLVWFHILLLLAFFVAKMSIIRSKIILGSFALLLLCGVGGYSNAEKGVAQIQSKRSVLLGKLTSGEDPYLEYLINNVSERIANDKIILSKLKSPYSSSNSFIKKKIEKVYLKNYFKDFQVDIEIIPLNKIVKNSGEIEVMGEKLDVLPTNYIDLYRSNGGRNYIKLVCFDDNLLIKNIVLTFSIISTNQIKVRSDKLLGEYTDAQLTSDEFSYLVFNNNRIISQYGFLFDFLSNNQVSNNKWLDNYLEQSDASHMIFKLKDTTMIVSYRFSFMSSFMDSSLFLIILMTGMIVLYLMLNSVFKRYSLSLTQRLQLIFTLTVLTTFILILAVNITSIKNSNEQQLQDENLQKAKRIAESVSFLLNEEELNKVEIERKINLLADNNRSDIHLYNKQGRLIISSQNEIFDKHLKSDLLDYSLLQNVGKRMQDERIGRLNYTAAYYPVKSNSGSLLGFVNVPFFESEEGLESRVNELCYDTIKVSMIVLLLVLITTYYVTSRISRPIGMLSEKIDTMDFEKDNDMLKWKADDEIGKLVSSYNSMLTKLSESREKLQLKEKEEAWKEMAKQVAHEIKNPLTPMKLSLQFLMKKMNSKDVIKSEELKTTTDSLLTQVENLSEIVTSFSEFAAMPEYQLSNDNIVDIIENVVQLHAKIANITFNTSNKVILVNVDKKAFSGIISNLILNALQSVEAKEPEIEVSVKTENNKAQIKIIDNGCGIPEEIQNKIFTPNFSTKYSGSGIGLALVKKGVEAFNGKIWFETKLNVGTTFYIDLPLS